MSPRDESLKDALTVHLKSPSSSYQSDQIDLPRDHFQTALNNGSGSNVRPTKEKRKLRYAFRLLLLALFVLALVLSVFGFPRNKDQGNHEVSNDISNDSSNDIIRQALLELNHSMQGRVWMQDLDDLTLFQEAARVWRQDRGMPQAVVEVATVEDVQLSVPVLGHLQKQHGLPFRIRSGGHNKAGFSTVDKGVVLSLKHMKQRSIIIQDEDEDDDDETTTAQGIDVMATIQPGAIVEDILDTFLQGKKNHSDYQYTGYAGAVGQCGKVAEGGWVLGGGVGFMARLLGMGIDNVQEFQIVLANGTLVVANQMKTNRHADLFWALRGAGSGNFGVVTSMKYKLHSGVPDEQLFQKIMIPNDDNLGDFLYQLGALNTDPEFFVVVGGREGNMTAAYMSWFSTDSSSIMEFPTVGNQHFETQIKPILPPSAIFQDTYQSFLWTESTHEMFDKPGYSTGVWAAQAWQGFLMPVNNTQDVWQTITNIMAKGMELAPNLEHHIELWGGAISDVRANETAFPYRDAVYNVGVLLVILDYDETAPKRFQEQVDSVNAWWPRVAEYLTGSYLNYPMNSLRPEEYPNLYWGHHLERLVEIKRRYDPDNIFAYEQSVPL
ncbi:Cannabidiolic acid synthase-like [Seminavis robusta]|uniref:Cannabidiolic acid synthase-like n=1 Tax=Seminavis robusta TaxID=568900 RepID=A0A9N8DCY0_9STRA|nr:Cannabidiolic acid synthase-like [Seminavis robusta]|eukprot:Sro33_g021500.1 Cannabidiolic acid synthase-like (607) ;mRNA; f:92275-94095